MPSITFLLTRAKTYQIQPTLLPPLLNPTFPKQCS